MAVFLVALDLIVNGQISSNLKSGKITIATGNPLDSLNSIIDSLNPYLKICPWLTTPHLGQARGVSESVQ